MQGADRARLLLVQGLPLELKVPGCDLAVTSQRLVSRLACSLQVPQCLLLQPAGGAVLPGADARPSLKPAIKMPGTCAGPEDKGTILCEVRQTSASVSVQTTQCALPCTSQKLLSDASASSCHTCVWTAGTAQACAASSCRQLCSMCTQMSRQGSWSACWQ